MKNFISTALKIEDNQLFILDQTLLPHKEEWLHSKSPDEMCDIILQLKVRGAPLIGVAAACSLALYAQEGASVEEIKSAAEKLNQARPTAVNLMMAMDRMVFHNQNTQTEELIRIAESIFSEDVELCEKMAQNGSELIQDGDGILTHCNTGGLATAGIGTAFGVILKAHQQNKKIHVFVDETRPLLQGGRLTTWELEKHGIPYTLICDNMAATLMRSGKIQKVFVGADRIALNGDFANKIGTYNVAVLAQYHKVNFHPVAPYTTIDFECESGKDIPIEERKKEEVQGVCGHLNGKKQEVLWAPEKASVYNPAFDVTPANLVTSLVLDSGVYTSEDLQNGQLKKRKN